MRKIIIALAIALVIMTGCIYIRPFPAEPGSNKVQPPATATFTVVPGSVIAASNRPATNSFTVTPQGERVVTLSLVQAESGSLVKSSATYTKSSAVCAGDNAANFASRAFLSFDLTSLPPTAVISEAVLDLTGNTALGTPTYSKANWGNMGALEVYQYQYGVIGEYGQDRL